MVLAEDLRQAVLQAALQGKLTEQFETDSDVDEILINIQEEKNRLIADKKIKKEKVLPETQKEDIPFKIPKNWRYVRLGDVLRVSSGDSLTSKNMIEGNIPVYGGNGINGYHNKSNINRTTLTIGRVGANCGAVHITEEKAWVTDNAFIVSFLIKQVNISYWAIILRALDLGNKSKATAQPVISGKTIYPVLAPLPPIEEQQRIVNKINEIMPKIEEYEKIEKELEALKKEFPSDMKEAFLQAAMQGKLTEQLESDSSVDELLLLIQKEKKQLIKEKKIYKDKKLVEDVEDKFDIDIPNNWRFVNLQEICTQITDGEHKTPNRVPEYQGYYLLSARNILNGKLILDDVDYVSKKEYDVISKRCNPHRNDILISCSGSIGRCCLIGDDNNYVMVRSAAMIHCLQMNNKYIMYAIQSPYIQAQIGELKKQSVQANLFQSAIASLLIPIPPIEEQQRIVERLDALLPLCEDLK